MIGVLAVDQTVPRVAGAGLFEETFVVGGAAPDVCAGDVVGQDGVWDWVGWHLIGIQQCVTHGGKSVTVIGDIHLQAEPELVEVAQALGGAAGFFGAGQCRQKK